MDSNYLNRIMHTRNSDNIGYGIDFFCNLIIILYVFTCAIDINTFDNFL